MALIEFVKADDPGYKKSRRKATPKARKAAAKAEPEAAPAAGEVTPTPAEGEKQA
jgi:large subunit ribosomal protein L17